MQASTPNAMSYFRTVAELLLSIQVSDREGRIIPVDEGASQAVDRILSVRAACGKVMLIGNGGSAAIAGHMQNDLAKALGVRAMVFDETPLMTALSNDHGYETVFERPVELWAERGDLLLAISSSGQSENILRAAHMARAQSCHVISLTGFIAENPLRSIGHLNFYVPSAVYGYVELAHSVLTHFITDSAAMSLQEKANLYPSISK